MAEWPKRRVTADRKKSIDTDWSSRSPSSEHQNSPGADCPHSGLEIPLPLLSDSRELRVSDVCPNDSGCPNGCSPALALLSVDERACCSEPERAIMFPPLDMRDTGVGWARIMTGECIPVVELASVCRRLDMIELGSCAGLRGESVAGSSPDAAHAGWSGPLSNEARRLATSIASSTSTYSDRTGVITFEYDPCIDDREEPRPEATPLLSVVEARMRISNPEPAVGDAGFEPTRAGAAAAAAIGSDSAGETTSAELAPLSESFFLLLGFLSESFLLFRDRCLGESSATGTLDTSKYCAGESDGGAAAAADAEIFGDDDCDGRSEGMPEVKSAYWREDSSPATASGCSMYSGSPPP